MNQDQRSAPSVPERVRSHDTGEGEEGETNNRSQLCKSQLQLRDVLKKKRKRKSKGRRIEERTKFVRFTVDEGRIRKVTGREEDYVIDNAIELYGQVSIIDSNTYVHTYIRTYIQHCAFIPGPYRPIPVGNCPLLCVTSPLKTIPKSHKHTRTTTRSSSLLLPHLHMNPNWAWGMVVVVGREGW